jgi:hypothetical protein
MGFDLANQTPTPDNISQITGMLWPKEKRVLYYLGAKLYSGIGDIVELGCYVGLSTSCLARGVADNARITNKQKRIHTYDWFQFLDHPPYNESMNKLGVAVDQNLVNIFITNTRPWASMIDLHQGDLLEQSWIGQPIEILFVDAAKTWQLNDHIVQTFFPSLIPGYSYVAHQDYLYWHNPWVPITMEWLGDCFEVVDCSATTVTFKLIKPLPIGRLRQGVRGLPNAAKIALMDRALARAHGPAKPILMVTKARLLSELEGWEPANKLLDEIVRTHSESSLIPKYIQEIREWEARETKTPFPDCLLPPEHASLGQIVGGGRE